MEVILIIEWKVNQIAFFLIKHVEEYYFLYLVIVSEVKHC